MKPYPSSKILIVLPFWDGDKKMAMQLAKFLADLEPEHSELADFLFVARFDCDHDVTAEAYVSRKFNIFSYRSKRRGVGWPGGCNAIFFGSLEWVYHKMASGQVPNYKAVLILGADGAPFCKDWLSKLIARWDEVSKNGTVKMAGALLLNGHGGRDHINGDCVFFSGDLKFLKWLAVTVGDVHTLAGWDWVLADEFSARGWANIPEIRSMWQWTNPFTDSDWTRQVRDGIVWLHGVKHFDLLNLSKQHLLPKKT